MNLVTEGDGLRNGSSCLRGTKAEPQDQEQNGQQEQGPNKADLRPDVRTRTEDLRHLGIQPTRTGERRKSTPYPYYTTDWIPRARDRVD